MREIRLKSLCDMFFKYCFRNKINIRPYQIYIAIIIRTPSIATCNFIIYNHHFVPKIINLTQKIQLRTVAAISVDLDFLCIKSCHEAISHRNKQPYIKKLQMVFTYLHIYQKMFSFFCYTMSEIDFWDLNSTWLGQILCEFTLVQFIRPWAVKSCNPYKINWQQDIGCEIK